MTKDAIKKFTERVAVEWWGIQEEYTERLKSLFGPPIDTSEDVRPTMLPLEYKDRAND